MTILKGNKNELIAFIVRAVSFTNARFVKLVILDVLLNGSLLL